MALCEKFTMSVVTFENLTKSSVEVDPLLFGIYGGLHSSATYVPFGCGVKCGVNTECQNFKTCSICRLGKCSAPGGCGDFCFANEECFSGVCVGNCEYNRCGRKGCAENCQNSDQCQTGSKTCQTCRLGRCVSSGECGSYCLTPVDCFGGACVAKCKNFQCVPEL